MPLIIKKHLFRFSSQQLRDMREMGLVEKMCISRVQELLVPCESPHETKEKCMVIYVFGHVHALINGYIEKCEFADILEINQCNVNTWSQRQCGVLLH